MSTKHGGFSQNPYKGLNLGNQVGDDPLCVQRNRDAFALQLGARPVFLNQVHANQVISLDPFTPDGLTADACWTQHPGLACTVMVADCLPVLLTNLQGSIVGAAHAGWRGLAGLGCEGGVGVIEQLLCAMTARLGTQHDHKPQWAAWLGPCIGPEHFEVGAVVREAFGGDPQSLACFIPKPSHLHEQSMGGADISPKEPKWLANLAGLAALRLRRAGVSVIVGNTDSASHGDWCTYRGEPYFYSHRRERITGRMAASIWIQEE